MSDAYDPLDGLFEAPKTGEENREAPQEALAADDNRANGAEAGEEQKEEPAAGAGQPASKMVPIEALDEARQRARDAEERLAKLSSGKEPEVETSDEDADPFQLGEPPDRAEDPAGYAEWLNAGTHMAIINDRLNRSEKDARREHGGEFVDKVRDWAMAKFEKDPDFTQRVMLNIDPYDVAISLYNEEQERETFKGLPEEVRKGLSDEELEMIRSYRAGKTNGSTAGDETRTSGQNEQPRQPNGQFVGGRKQPDAVPKSINSTPAAVGKGGKGNGAVYEGAAFDEVFK